MWGPTSGSGLTGVGWWGGGDREGGGGERKGEEREREREVLDPWKVPGSYAEACGTRTVRGWTAGIGVLGRDNGQDIMGSTRRGAGHDQERDPTT